MPDAPTLTGVAPMFLADDVVRTAEWYRDHLGFEIGEYFYEGHGDHEHGDGHDDGHGHEHDHDHGDHAHSGEPGFVIVERDGCRLMFGRTVKPGLGVHSLVEFKEYSSDAYFWVDGVEALCASVKESGTPLASDLEYQPYGLAEFRVQDCDGRFITFGGIPASPGTR